MSFLLSYGASVLREIRNAIGPMLKVDVNTASRMRGRYARICVQIDLSRPLIIMVLIGSLVQEVVYEGISVLYFGYGRVGHKRDGYPYVIRSREKAVET
nr:hypothetical protein CFP56_27217 [Quercus suber]